MEDFQEPAPSPQTPSPITTPTPQTTPGTQLIPDVISKEISQLPSQLPNDQKQKKWKKVITISIISINLILLVYLGSIILAKYLKQYRNDKNQPVNPSGQTPSPTKYPVISIAPSTTPTQTLTPTATTKATIQRSSVHYYLKPEIPIDEIALTLVYYVPKSSSINERWLDGLKANASALKNFYERELNHKITISYYVYPQPVRSTIDYNLNIPNTSPDYENACGQALNSAMSEIKPIVKPKYFGDLNLWAVIFEGLNCSYGPDSNLIVPGYVINYFFDPSSQIMAGKAISHEFGHLLGLIDTFNDPQSMVHNGKQESYYSIMGHGQGDGKWHSLDEEFLSDSEKNGLGI